MAGLSPFFGTVYQIMQLQKLVNMFGGDLLQRYGQKVHKLTLHGGFSCPNRDGTIGRGGCTFCNVASFADEAQQHKSIAEQLAHQASLVNRAKQYLAYFQAYTSTWAEVQVLRSMYQQAVAQANIVGLCVGTRPDCVPEAVLDLLSEYREKGYEIWLELGLQTAHDKTLHRINRGHDFACYQRTTRLARERGLKVCSHLIVGLPGEGQQHGLETLEKVVETGVDGIKLHPLHIVKGSIMAKAVKQYRARRLYGDGGRDDSPHAAGDCLPPHLRQRPPSNASGTALVREPVDGDGGNRPLSSGKRRTGFGAGPSVGSPSTDGGRLADSPACRAQSD